MFNTYFFLFVITSSIVRGNEDDYTYVSDLSQDDCTSRNENYGYYYFHLKSENLSPYCRPFQSKYIKQCTGDPEKDIKVCPSAYKCSKKCTLSINVAYPCEDDDYCKETVSKRSRCKPFCSAVPPNGNNVGPCLAYYAKTRDYEETYYTAEKFKPQCLNDGTWAPKQCKGGITGRCFCYNPEGGRIFGQAKYKDAKDMTCACSRKKYELSQSYDVYSSLHCDSMGNYEPLQCDRGFCWCAESKTGDLTSAVVPEDNVKRLPCYDVNKVGDQYLRQCDSELWAMSKISYKFKLHGVIEPHFKIMDCDYDGAFGRFNIISGMAYCTWRDNTKLLPYVREWKNVTPDQVTCFCARDEKMKINQQACEGSGEYVTSTPIFSANKYYCLDSDGYQKNNGATKPIDCKDVY